MRTEVVEYNGFDWLSDEPDATRQVRLTVSYATGLIEVRRELYKQDAQRAIETDEARRAFRLYLYPEIAAVVTHAEGVNWPPTPDELMAFPGPFLDEIGAAMLRVNPHWRGNGATTEDPKASAPASTNDLPPA